MRILCEVKGARPLHLCDTFDGLPAPAAQCHEGAVLRPGQFGAGLEGVERHLAGYPAVFYHPGRFPESVKACTESGTGGERAAGGSSGELVELRSGRAVSTARREAAYAARADPPSGPTCEVQAGSIVGTTRRGASAFATSGAAIRKSGPVSFAAARFSLVHLDLDLAEGTAAALTYFYPRMVPGGIILCHDHSILPGVASALEDFLADKPELLIKFPTTLAMVVKGNSVMLILYLG